MPKVYVEEISHELADILAELTVSKRRSGRINANRWVRRVSHRTTRDPLSDHRIQMREGRHAPFTLTLRGGSTQQLKGQPAVIAWSERKQGGWRVSVIHTPKGPHSEPEEFDPPERLDELMSILKLSDVSGRQDEEQDDNQHGISFVNPF